MCPYTRPSPEAPPVSFPTAEKRYVGSSTWGTTRSTPFSTAVDTTVENAQRMMREDVEAHPASGSWDEFRQVLRGRVTPVTWRTWLEALMIREHEGDIITVVATSVTDLSSRK
jgi:hypothetical protein